MEVVYETVEVTFTDAVEHKYHKVYSLQIKEDMVHMGMEDAVILLPLRNIFVIEAKISEEMKQTLGR